MTKKILYTCNSCEKKIRADEMIEILGVLKLPGEISLSMAVHFHEDCLPPALHEWAQRALGNELDAVLPVEPVLAVQAVPSPRAALSVIVVVSVHPVVVMGDVSGRLLRDFDGLFRRHEGVS